MALLVYSQLKRPTMFLFLVLVGGLGFDDWENDSFTNFTIAKKGKRKVMDLTEEGSSETKVPAKKLAVTHTPRSKGGLDCLTHCF